MKVATYVSLENDLPKFATDIQISPLHCLPFTEVQNKWRYKEKLKEVSSFPMNF